MNSRTALILAFTSLGMVSGCNDSGLPMVPVSGKITFAGGPPPAAGTVTFTPISVADGLPRRPGTARFETDGNFRVTSFKKNDGLIPGSYYANVSCWQGEPSHKDPSSYERMNNVPKGFEAPPVAVDPEADEVEVTIDVPKKK